MTRVCVTWDREETARLIGCREALEASDETAKAARGLMIQPCFGVPREPVKAFVTNSGPSSRLALNRALRTVLDGITATLGDGYQSRERDVEHALVSLAAIAAALGVQEEGR